MNKMKNFILAITSFIATVVLLSQVALAQSDDWDPKHTTAAAGDEPLTNLNSGRSADPKIAQGASPDSGENNQDPNCVPCKAMRAPVKRIGDRTNVGDKATGDSSGSNSGQKGTK